MTPPVLTELREATAASHRRLESRITLADATLTPAEYRSTLRAYLGFYAPLEAQLDHVAGPISALQWQDRRKSHLLEADLQRLDSGSTERIDLPHCSALPSIDGLAKAVGLLYVMEGATLGGRYLLKLLDPALASSGATAFLQGYGTATAQRWKQFIDYLWEIEAPQERRDAVATAVATFTSFECWLDECGVLK